MEQAMLDALRIPSVERIVFEQTPLMLAICQVRFRPILSISEPAGVAPLQRALLERYPILNPFGELEFKLQGLPSQTQIEPGTPAHRWKFTDPDDTWTVVLALDFITIETRRYETFEDFLVRLRELLTAFGESFPRTIGTRIGLRYINEIRAADERWGEVVRPGLLGPVGEPELSEQIDQAIQQIVLKVDDDQGINFRHGILEGTAVQPRPGDEPPASKFYLLDYDAYREYPRPGSLLLDPDVVCRQVEIHHDAIERLFRWSLTEEYTASLGVRSHVENP
jgi:uncharacterized protein (TIGR04255 family)